MATIPKKPPVSGSSGRMSPASGPTSPGAPRGAARASTPSTPPANGVTRSRSVKTANGTPISARAAVKKPTGLGPSALGNSTSVADTAEEDARIEAAALIEDLKERLQKAEHASEEFHKQIQVLQSRLDDALQDQGKLEDRLHEEEERIEGLENDKRESIRQRRELESIYEAERAASMKEKEATQIREEELQGIIQRLKESLSQREQRPGSGDEGRLSRTASSPTLETGHNHFAPPSSLQRSNSKNNSKLILQKDKVIESLRLELAEAQIKMMEMENMGDATRRVQELERTLLDTRMTNARLMEDIDSYQLLLSEKTLNGDFSRNDILRGNSSVDVDRTPSRSGPSTSLADELSSAVEDTDEAMEPERIRRAESEISALKEQNKALTLYINKIIDRILQHQGGYENILSNQDDDEPLAAPGAPAPAPAPQRPPPPNKDKELPPPPPPKENQPPISQQPSSSLLQRAKSVAYGGNKPKPRPMTTYIPPTKEPGVTENPETAPSIPLQRSKSNRMSMDVGLKRRSTTTDWNAAAVVSNMYRGPSGEHTTPASPGIVSPRNSLFAFRTPSGNVPTVESIKEDGQPVVANEEDPDTARKTALDALNGKEESIPSVDSPSPPRSTTSREDRAAAAGGAAVMTGRQMRPLRLVREAEEEQKRANRASWVPQGLTGWFNKGENQ